jgi:hypothetical protein
MSRLAAIVCEIARKLLPREGRLASLATRQHGVVARWQLLLLGFTSDTIQDALEAGRLLPVRRGVYAVGHRRLTTQSRRMAAVLACGPEAVLSHRTAIAD